ncbi:MAG: alpha-hydroxy-acid oxidizing protein [Chloroflexi bacterium]|nr:alpha-hydroxy-acid oxidizing protein [Chloroflexota bacterium]
MAINIDDLRRIARRRLPRAVFDFVDGGAEDETTLRANRLAFQHLTFRPRALVDVSERDQRTTVLGQPVSMPLILAPTGLAGMVWPRGEIEAARAAARRGIIYTVSTHAACSIEEIAEATSGPLWFQLYVLRDRDLTRSLVERAKAAGYRALCLTIDVPILGQRERDLRNGATIPPKITVRNAVDALQRIAWIRGVLRGPGITFKNFVGAQVGLGSDPVALWQFISRQHDPSVDWDDLDWFRSIWSGPLAVKGIMTGEDARRAVEHGVDAIIVSNHGGRQLDGLPASIEVLPEVADAVGDRAEVILDGGIRRGTDVVKAIALGARACTIGRPLLYGLAAGGAAGVDRAIEILYNEIDRALGLIGRPRLADVDRSAVRLAGSYLADLERRGAPLGIHQPAR